MKGKHHSEETKEKCRLATIKRIKEGKFPQTNSSINLIFESVLNKLGVEYEKEFHFGHFLYDFKVQNFLIEIQGDYWHCNPNIDEYKFGYKTSDLLKRNYARDVSKRK